MFYRLILNSFLVAHKSKDEIIENQNSELNNGLEVYHRWCSQLLTIRTSAIAITFFVCGVSGVYLINLPLYLFGLNHIDYLSLSGLWTVTCIVTLWTVHLWFRSRNVCCSNQYQSPFLLFSLNGNPSMMWSPMIRIIVYPLLSLFTTSFYLSWIGVPFSSIIQYDDTNTSNHPEIPQSLILNYSVLWLSYIYGYFPDVMYHRNTLYFKSLQPNRGIFLKQSLVKSLIANFVQTLTFCVCTLSMWWILHLLFWDFQLTIGLYCDLNSENALCTVLNSMSLLCAGLNSSNLSIETHI